MANIDPEGIAVGTGEASRMEVTLKNIPRWGTSLHMRDINKIQYADFPICVIQEDTFLDYYYYYLVSAYLLNPLFSIVYG